MKNNVLFIVILFLSIISMSEQTKYMSKISKNEYDCLFYEKMIASPIEIHILSEINQDINSLGCFFEIILEKNLNKEECSKAEPPKNSYTIEFTFSKDKEDSNIQIVKCLDENKECSRNKEKLKFLNEINSEEILYDDISVSIDDSGIKIISKNFIIFEDKIKLKNYFGDEF